MTSQVSDAEMLFAAKRDEVVLTSKSNVRVYATVRNKAFYTGRQLSRKCEESFAESMQRRCDCIVSTNHVKRQVFLGTWHAKHSTIGKERGTKQLPSAPPTQYRRVA